MLPVGNWRIKTGEEKSERGCLIHFTKIDVKYEEFPTSIKPSSFMRVFISLIYYNILRRKFSKPTLVKNKKIFSMKKMILSALVLSLGFTVVNAQEIPERKSERPGMMQHKKRHHGMDQLKGLNLTEEQKAKFKTSNESFRTQMADLKKNDGITVKEWKEKAESIRKAHKAEMQKILTADQKAQLEKRKVEGKAKHEEAQKKMGERMKANLNLTAEQSAKMEANRKAMREEMTKIRDNKSLTEQQKKEQMVQLHKKQKETLKSILTAEQIQKLKERRPENKDRRPGTEKNKTI
jgi:Spy/CpxP family protein refolding chaperone